tara:strand:+ start:2368 stop:3879 length:1512 start_codon:yes stop_codon:yes gene_type:complete
MKHKMLHIKPNLGSCIYKVSKYKIPLFIATLAAMFLTNVNADTIEIDDILIESSVVSEFPEGIRIKAKVSGKNEISSIAFRFTVGQRPRASYTYLCPVESIGAQSGIDCANIEPGFTVEGELFWRTDIGGRYIPPGTIITYTFEITDSEGIRETKKQEFIYHDSRFQWDEITKGPITIAYHGPVKTRAELLLKAMLDTLKVMGPLLGTGTEAPIRATMYNNTKEMLGGLPPGSTTIRRELITAGQAFSDAGIVLTLGSGNDAEGTASHEVTHILVHRAGHNPVRNVPVWLNEGLAEYGNIKPGFSYDIALEFALANDRLLPVMRLGSMPGTPEDAIIFYGQSRSIVKMMVNELGRDKMKELMAELKSGINMEDAAVNVYGLTLIEIENMWRDSVGAPEYVPPVKGREIPTAVPLPNVLLYSLTPQPETETIGDSGDKSIEILTENSTEPSTDTNSESLSIESKNASSSIFSGICSSPGPSADAFMTTMLIGLGLMALRKRIRK